MHSMTYWLWNDPRHRHHAMQAPGPHHVEPSRRSRPLLQRADQLTIAAILAVLLLALVLSLLLRGAHRGRLVEIDRAAPLTVDFKVDINRAEWPELALLPGIGETLARRIVRQREREGPFGDRQDLLRVRGIGPKTLEAIEPYLLPVTSTSAATDQ